MGVLGRHRRRYRGRGAPPWFPARRSAADRLITNFGESCMDIVRADQIGSLLRPPELLQAWGQLFAGQLSPEGLQEIEDRAIGAVLARQQRTGIGIYTDGEFR